MTTTMEDIKEYKIRRNRIALLSALVDTDSVIREAAVIALIEIGDPRDVEAVQQYLMLESDVHIRQRVLLVLHSAKMYGDPDFLDAYQHKNVELSGNAISDVKGEESVQLAQPIAVPLPKQLTVRRKWSRVWGVVLLVVFFFSVSYAIESQSYVRWGYLMFGILSEVMAIVLFVKERSVMKTDDSRLKKEALPLENQEVSKEHFTRMFHHRDIFAMAILYEGPIPDVESVTPEMIAEEVLLSLHQDERYADSRLSVSAVVKMERVADYKYFSSEDYLPGADLDNLLGRCMDEIRGRVIMDDPLIQKIAAQMSRVKVFTPTLGNVWVGMYISMI